MFVKDPTNTERESTSYTVNGSNWYFFAYVGFTYAYGTFVAQHQQVLHQAGGLLLDRLKQAWIPIASIKVQRDPDDMQLSLYSGRSEGMRSSSRPP